MPSTGFEPVGSGAPKPANFDEMTAAWNEPHRQQIEEAKYREQLRTEGGRWQ